MNEAQRRTNGGRSDLCTIEESAEGGNEGMTNDQKVGRHKVTRMIEGMEIEVKENEENSVKFAWRASD